jgi:hypothetical protein
MLVCTLIRSNPPSLRDAADLSGVKRLDESFAGKAVLGGTQQIASRADFCD